MAPTDRPADAGPTGAEAATVLEPDTAERCPRCGAPIAGSWLTCVRCGAALAQPAELPLGSTLCDGRYVMDRVLGRGGFGITYEARDLRLQRRVAVKELFPAAAVRHGATVVAPPEERAAFSDARARFLREARLLARFTHPGIVRIYEAFEEHRTVYLVMELLDGPTLAEVAKARGLPFTGEEVVDVVRHVGGALTQVHEAGVLHRDVNPSNIVCTENGRSVLIDFGIARTFDRATGPVTQVVTPGYAPPEQYRSDVELTAASDVYGLAATSYRLATGRIPPAAPERLAGVGIEPPWRTNPAVTKSLSDALLDGLELDPSHRPQSIAAFLARIGTGWSAAAPPELAAAPPTARPSPPPPPPVPARVLVPPPRPAVHAGQAVRGADRIAPGPRPVGPHRRGRRTVLLPALLAAVAFASAAPVVAAVLLVVAGLPALATVGDAAVHQHRRITGQGWRPWHRWPPGVVLPLRALRNIGVSVVRAVPALAFGAAVVGAAALLRHAHVAPAIRVAVVRGGGALLGLGLAWPATSGGVNFRSGLGTERVVDELLDRRDRLRPVGLAVVLVCTAVVAASLFFTPEIWPF